LGLIPPRGFPPLFSLLSTSTVGEKRKRKKKKKVIVGIKKCYCVSETFGKKKKLRNNQQVCDQ
jgi:hypothetical protein